MPRPDMHDLYSQDMRQMFNDLEAEDLARKDWLRSLPGWPFLPCPICHGTQGCDHSGPERARAAIPNLVVPNF